MTQIATVEQILNPQYAIVSVPRKSACGHDCEECAGCGVTGAAVRAKAANPIGAAPGQKVVVQSDTKKMLRIVALVYLTPVVLFLAGYLLTALLGASVGVQYFTAAVGFFAGIVAAVAYADCATLWANVMALPPALSSIMILPTWRSCSAGATRDPAPQRGAWSVP